MSDSPARGCHRLVAIVRNTGSAESLQTCELLALAEWLSQPPNDEDAWFWCEEVCLPIVRELARRLQRQSDNQTLELPQLLSQINAMRRSQTAAESVRNKPRSEKLSLYHRKAVAEKAIDDLLDRPLQPTLFGEPT